MAYKLKGFRVLLIDDNTPVRLLVRSLLLDLGFGHVYAEATVEKGWDVYCTQQPDFILIDWRVDGDDALAFTRRIRKEPGSPNPSIPIIFMTGFTNKQRVFEARDAGVTEFLNKPFSVQLLTERLAYIIEKPRDFVLAPKYTGPDRRRRNDGVASEKKKRKIDKAQQEKK